MHNVCIKTFKTFFCPQENMTTVIRFVPHWFKVQEQVQGKGGSLLWTVINVKGVSKHRLVFRVITLESFCLSLLIIMNISHVHVDINTTHTYVIWRNVKVRIMQIKITPCNTYKRDILIYGIIVNDLPLAAKK